MQLPKHIHTVEEVKLLTPKGPWKTKSDAQLTVPFVMPYAGAMEYLSYEEEELKDIPEDIRGLRIYHVRGIPTGTLGAHEFHRVRKEIAFCLEGRVRWTCEDLSGNKRDFELTPGMGVSLPPYILHTYEALQENSGLEVIANTLFNPDEKGTHDSYSSDEFRELQQLIFVNF